MITKGEEHQITNLSEYKANDLTNIITELQQHSNTYTKNKVYLEEVSDTTVSLSICSPELVEKIQEIFKEVKKEQEQMDLVNEKTLKLVNTECDPTVKEFIKMERLNGSFRSFNKYYEMLRVIYKLYKTCSMFDAMRERNVKVSNKIDSLLHMIAEKKEQLEKIKNGYERFKEELKVSKDKYKRLFENLSKKLERYIDDEDSHREYNVDSLEDINKDVEEVDKEEYEYIKDKIELAKVELDYIIMEKLKLREQIEESEIKLCSLDLDIKNKKIELEKYEPKVQELKLIAGKYEGLIDLYKKVEVNIGKFNHLNHNTRLMLEERKDELIIFEKQARGKLNELAAELKKCKEELEELKGNHAQKLSDTNALDEVYKAKLKCKDNLNEELYNMNNELERLKQEIKKQEEIKEANHKKIKNADVVFVKTMKELKGKQVKVIELEENSNKRDNKNSISCGDMQQYNRKNQERFIKCSIDDLEGEVVDLNYKEESKHNESIPKVKCFWIACTQPDKATKELNSFPYDLKETGYELWIPFIRYMNWTNLTSLKLCDFKEKPTTELWNEVINTIKELKELLVLDLSRNNLTFESIKELLKALANHNLRCLMLDDLTMKEEKESKEIIIEHLPKTKLKHFSAKNIPISGMLTKLRCDKKLKGMKLEYLNICSKTNETYIEKEFEENRKAFLSIYQKTRIDLKIIYNQKDYTMILREEIAHECKHK